METLQLTKISSQELPLWNAIFAGSANVTCNLAGVDYTLFFHPAPLALEPGVALTLSLGGRKILVVLEEHTGLLEERIAQLVPEANLFDFPAEMAKAIIEAALEEAITRFEKATGKKTVLEEVLLNPDHRKDTDRRLFFSLTDKGGNKAIRGWISLAEDAALSILADLMGRTAATPLVSTASLPVRIALETGHTRLSLTELNQVEPMDIILMDEYYPSSTKGVRIRLPSSRSYMAELVEGTMTMKIMKEDAMPQDQGVQSQDEIAVTLVFELGQQDITIKDLGSFKPGYVFSLGCPLDKPVAIRANGKLIGYGEPVQIDNTLGVRVTALYDQETK